MRRQLLNLYIYLEVKLLFRCQKYQVGVAEHTKYQDSRPIKFVDFCFVPIEID